MKKLGILFLLVGLLGISSAVSSKADVTVNSEKIEDKGCFTTPPNNLQCFVLKDGQYLTWDHMGAKAYEVEISYSSACCPLSAALFPTKSYKTKTNAFLAPSSTCFSWRVRAVCANGTFGPWSASYCSCQSAG